MSEESLFPETGSLVDEDMMAKLSKECTRLNNLEKEVMEKEEQLKNLKKQVEIVSRETIPAIFNELNLSSLQLSTGEKVEIKDELKASIAQKNYLEAYKNMVDAEGGDEEKIDSLFKTQTVIDGLDDELLDFLLEEEITYDVKRSIHHQTLKKYCKERLEKGLTIPDGISTFQYQETKITR